MSQRMEQISKSKAWQLACRVVKPRSTVPKVVEDHIVMKNRVAIASRLLDSSIPIGAEDKLVDELRKSLFFSMMQPGESVGISCAQAIGESVTQSALNTFHTAGLDTGVNSVMKRIEYIIDIPKAKTSRRPHIVTAYHKDVRLSLTDLYNATRQYTVEVKFGSLIKRNTVLASRDIPAQPRKWAELSGNSAVDAHTRWLEIEVDLSLIFMYRISTNLLRRTLGRQAIVPSYASIVNDTYLVYLPISGDDKVCSVIDFVSRHRLVGIPGTTAYNYRKDDSGRWCVVLEGATFVEVLKYTNVYDPCLTTGMRVSDISDTIGVYASWIALQKLAREIFGDSVSRADIALLATKITFQGKPMPCTRFTMRTNQSPLAKISFEESQGGFRTAGLFQEREQFKTLSSMVIAGKLPPIGSAISTPLLDQSYFKPVDNNLQPDDDMDFEMEPEVEQNLPSDDEDGPMY